MDKKPRLIDADALKRAMEEMLMSGKDAVESAYINEVVQIVIDEAPTIEAEPARHGRWVQGNIRPKSYFRLCSVCKKLAYFCGEGCSYKFCPHCGARMDGGVNG